LPDRRIDKIKNHPNLVRDNKTKAILNTNKEEILKYQHQKQLDDRIHTLEEVVKNLQSELNELKRSFN